MFQEALMGASAAWRMRGCLLCIASCGTCCWVATHACFGGYRPVMHGLQCIVTDGCRTGRRAACAQNTP